MAEPPTPALRTKRECSNTRPATSSSIIATVLIRPPLLADAAVGSSTRPVSVVEGSVGLERLGTPLVDQILVSSADRDLGSQDFSKCNKLKGL